MPKGKLHRFSVAEHNQAMEIKKSYMKSGVSEEEAERRAWATVMAQKKRRVGLGALRKK